MCVHVCVCRPYYAPVSFKVFKGDLSSSFTSTPPTSVPTLFPRASLSGCLSVSGSPSCVSPVCVTECIPSTGRGPSTSYRFHPPTYLPSRSPTCPHSSVVHLLLVFLFSEVHFSLGVYTGSHSVCLCQHNVVPLV